MEVRFRWTVSQRQLLQSDKTCRPEVVSWSLMKHEELLHHYSAALPAPPPGALPFLVLLPISSLSAFTSGLLPDLLAEPLHLSLDCNKTLAPQSPRLQSGPATITSRGRWPRVSAVCHRYLGMKLHSPGCSRPGPLTRLHYPRGSAGFNDVTDLNGKQAFFKWMKTEDSANETVLRNT